MTGILINADDFGLSEGVCNAIEVLLENHWISSTSLMLCAEKAFELIPKYNIKRWTGSVGIHLQLTSGNCLSNPKDVPSLLIPGTKKFQDPRGRVVLSVFEVEKEWRTQITAGMELLGGLPSHLDSHHGVHRIPELFDLYLNLASEFGIQVRGTISNDAWKMRSRGVHGSIALVRNWTGKNLSKDDLIAQIAEVIIAYPEENFLELIIHPGYSDDYLRSISSLSDARENDFKVIRELGDEGWSLNTNLNLISRLEVISKYGSHT